jgi:molybdenum cofactor guanylyltransferase
MKRTPQPAGGDAWTIWILAGGQSRRMGRDKSRIIIAGKTLLQHVRAAALATGLPVRTIRTDAVPRCGPLGGVLTGLRRARAGWALFLSCDMPLVTPRLLEELVRLVGAKQRPVFVRSERGFGFPLALPVSARTTVERLIAEGRPSLQRLAAAVAAEGRTLPAGRQRELSNANTPEELAALRRLLTTEHTWEPPKKCNRLRAELDCTMHQTIPGRTVS